VNWRLRPTGVAARLRALSAIGHQVVWVVGDHGTVLRTDDAGARWHRVDPPGAEDLKFRAVRAHTAHHAVVLSFGAGPAARVLRTQNGGMSWQLAWCNADPVRFVDCLAFATPTDTRMVPSQAGGSSRRGLCVG
jgi:photosystem II stability/assembly factor-like uncharacterized protein